MKSTLALIVALFAAAEAFSSSFAGSSVGNAVTNGGQTTMEYIPSGMSKAQWEKIKQKERNANQGKNLGKVGITTFKSRSFADWQKAGGKNLFPVDPTKVKNKKEIPYMQRPGGSADDSDISAKSLFGGFFGKKKKAESDPEPEQKGTNWWTLN